MFDSLFKWITGNRTQLLGQSTINQLIQNKTNICSVCTIQIYLVSEESLYWENYLSKSVVNRSRFDISYKVLFINCYSKAEKNSCNFIKECLSFGKSYNFWLLTNFWVNSWKALLIQKVYELQLKKTKRKIFIWLDITIDSTQIRCNVYIFTIRKILCFFKFFSFKGLVLLRNSKRFHYN